MTLKQMANKLRVQFNGMKRVERSTISRVLKKHGINSYSVTKKPLLTALQKQKRLKWALEHRNWTEKDWERVVFTDESVFRSHNSSKYQRVWRKKEQRFQEDCLQRTVKSQASVQVWGAFSSKGVSMLKRVQGNLNSQRYQAEIINDIKNVCECLVFPDKDYIFQQDLASCHNSLSTRQFLEDNNVKVLDWPGNSPDCNPIENIWNHLKRTLSGRMPTKSQAIWDVINREWHKLSTTFLKKLIHSMPRRIKAVIEARGGPTKY